MGHVGKAAAGWSDHIISRRQVEAKVRDQIKMGQRFKGNKSSQSEGRLRPVRLVGVSLLN